MLKGNDKIAKTIAAAALPSTWAAAEYAYYPAIYLLLTPGYLKALGDENFGLWVLTSTTASLGSLMNVGTGAANIKLISENTALGKNQEAHKTQRASLAIAGIAGLLTAVIIVALYQTIGKYAFHRMGTDRLLLTAAITAAVLALVEQIDTAYATSIKAKERFKQAASVEILSRTVQIGGGVIIVSHTKQLEHLFAFTIIVLLGRLFAKAQIANKLFPAQKYRLKLTDIRKVARLASWGWLLGASGVIFSLSDRFLIGSVLGAGALTTYSLLSQLATQVHSLPAAAISALFPRIVRRTVHKKNGDRTFLIKKILSINIALCTALALILLIGGVKFLQIWVGNDYATATDFHFLILVYWVLGLNIAFHYILLSNGQFSTAATANISAGIISVAIMTALVEPMKFRGVIIGRLVYAIFVLALYTQGIRKLLKSEKEAGAQNTLTKGLPSV